MCICMCIGYIQYVYMYVYKLYTIYAVIYQLRTRKLIRYLEEYSTSSRESGVKQPLECGRQTLAPMQIS